jgi:hypothetical protein
MSSITPASFVDDGSSFSKRMPRKPHTAHISAWLNSTGSETTSAYTGSYIDDGADMLLPSKQASGFGPINPKFYKQRKRRDDESCGPWNEDIQKAVVGDITQSLEKMRGIGGIEVKKAYENSGERQDKERKKDTITIPLPPRWGTFIIKADDGRVIVVEEHGEFDSGPKAEKEESGNKWVKAPTTISLPLSTPYSSEQECDKRPHKGKKKHKNVPEPIKMLTTILESEYEEDGDQASVGEDLMSPTDFVMTGGAGGWPSRHTSPVRSLIELGHSSRHSARKSLTKEKLESPVRSLPGSWPSPLQSPTKSVISVSDRSTSTGNSVQSWGKQSSRHSRGCKEFHKYSRHDGDNVSMRTHSTYKPPAVEDAPDTSSENASALKAGAWDKSHKSNSGDWGGSKIGSKHGSSSKKGSEKSWKAANEETWETEQPDSENNHASSIVQNWVSDRIKTTSDASTHKSRSRQHRNHNGSRSKSHVSSEASWDGYEKPKTMSEVSVAGTESERSLTDSQTSSRHSRRSAASEHRSHRSSRHESEVNWGGSEQSWGQSQKANCDGWGGDRTDSESGRGWD